MAKGGTQIVGGVGEFSSTPAAQNHNHGGELLDGLGVILGLSALAVAGSGGAGAPAPQLTPFDAACRVVAGAERGCPRAQAFMFRTGQLACAGSPAHQATGAILMQASQAMKHGLLPGGGLSPTFPPRAPLPAPPPAPPPVRAPIFVHPGAWAHVAPSPSPAPAPHFPLPPPPFMPGDGLPPGSSPPFPPPAGPDPGVPGVTPGASSSTPPGFTPDGGAPPPFPPFDSGAAPDGVMTSAPPDTYAPQGDFTYWGPPYDGQDPTAAVPDDSTWGTPSGDGSSYGNPDALDPSAWANVDATAQYAAGAYGRPMQAPCPFRSPVDAARKVVQGARKGDPRALAFVSRTVGLAVRGSRPHQYTAGVLAHAAKLTDRDAHTAKYCKRAMTIAGAIAGARRAHAAARVGAHGPYQSGPTLGAFPSARYVAPTGYSPDGTPLYGLTANYGSLLYGLGDLS